MDDGTRLPIHKRYQLVLNEKERKRQQIQAELAYLKALKDPENV
jgi:hypothetical protein